MFAIFGDIPFEVIGSPEALESARSYDYAEHAVIEDRPHLQWIHDGLETITFELMLHASFTNPQLQLYALRAAASSHVASALIFGDGEHRGYFVITAISVTARQLDSDGFPLAIRARLELKEWAMTSELDPAAPPIPQFTPIAAAAAANAGAPSNQIPAALVSQLAGLSAVLSTPFAPGALSPQMTPNDVPIAQIVRSQPL
ncbi:MAG: phage tail protein [Candidatus Binataceae bacterium]